MKRIWTIFTRDLKVMFRQSIAIMIIFAPIILAVGINLLSPGINDTTVNVALIEGENTVQETYLNDFAHVETFDSAQAVEERVMRRDNVIGILPEDDSYYLLKQGNEPEMVVEYTKLLATLYDSGASIEESNTQLIEFGETVPPLKKMFVNILLLIMPMLAGMLTALNIVEDKSEGTIRAISVTPTSTTAYIIAKSLTGMLIALVLTIVSLMITGFYFVNIGLVLLVALASTFLTMAIGFVQGVTSKDVMEAASSMKMIMLPMAASVIGNELVTGNWQIFFYWSPFYWAYRANEVILSGNGGGWNLVLYVGIIIAICGAAYALLLPKIKKGLR